MNRLLNDERYLNQNRNNLFDKLLYQDENNCDEDFSKEDHAPNPEIFLGTNGSQTTISLINNRKKNNFLNKSLDKDELLKCMREIGSDQNIENQSTSNSLHHDEKDNMHPSDLVKKSNHTYDYSKKLYFMNPIIKDSSDEKSENKLKKKFELKEKKKNKITKQIKNIKNKKNETNKNEINKKPRKPREKKEQKYSYKNFVQYLGRKVFSSMKNSLEKYLSKKYKKIIYPSNYNDLINKIEFEKWIEKKQLKKKYVNLKTFREIWIFDENENCKEQHFKMVLTKITKNLLKYHLTRQIMKDSQIKYIEDYKYQRYNLEAYLSKIPRFLSGIENPESFKSIKE